MKYQLLKMLQLLCLYLVSLSCFAQPLKINGLTSYQELNDEMFIAALRVASATNNRADLLTSKQRQQMELRFTASRVSSRRLTRQFLQNLAINNSGDDLDSHADEMVKFSQMFKGKFLEGDQLVIRHIPGKATEVILDDILLGSLKPSFYPMLLKTWIGSVPPSTEFRDALLGNTAISDSLLASFNQIRPSADRIATIKSWGGQAMSPELELGAPPAPILMAQTPTLAAAVLPEASTPAKTAKKKVPAPAKSKPKRRNRAVAFDDDKEEGNQTLTIASIRAQQSYQKLLVQETWKNITYPKRAIQRSLQGSIRLNVTVNRDGTIKKITVINASKHEMLNKAAIKAINKAAPFPPFSDKIRNKQHTFALPVVFKLQ